MQNIKRLLIITILGLTFSCSKTESSSSSSTTSTTTTTTKMTIFLNSVNGAVKDIDVYAYNQSTYSQFGDNTAKANGKATSDASGNAVFANIEYNGTFDNSTTNNFTFSAHYLANGVPKTKSISKVITKGSVSTLTIILD